MWYNIYATMKCNNAQLDIHTNHTTITAACYHQQALLISSPFLLDLGKMEWVIWRWSYYDDVAVDDDTLKLYNVRSRWWWMLIAVYCDDSSGENAVVVNCETGKKVPTNNVLNIIMIIIMRWQKSKIIIFLLMSWEGYIVTTITNGMPCHAILHKYKLKYFSRLSLLLNVECDVKVMKEEHDIIHIFRDF